MDNTEEFVGSLREWVGVFMQRSMADFLTYAKDKNLSMSQIGALMRIRHKGMTGVSDIGGDLGVTSAAASQLLERLVRSGLVFRNENPQDRRAKQIVLTKRGLQTVRKSMEARQRWFFTLAERMSVEERQLAISGLKLLITRTSELDRPSTDLNNA